MKKRGFTILFAAILFCFAALIFAACETVEPNGPGGAKGETVTITAELSKTEAEVGETVTVTYSATGGAAVSVTYTKDSGTAVPFSGSTFKPEAAGVYVFTFSAENADDVTKTLTVKAAAEPVAPVISLNIDGSPISDGAEVTVCVGETVGYAASATEGAAVSASYTIDGGQAQALDAASGNFTFETAGEYVFTLTAEGAEDFVLKVNAVAHTYAAGQLTYTAEEYAAAEDPVKLYCQNDYGCAAYITVSLPELSAPDTWQETVDAAATCTQAGAKTQTCTVTGSDGETQVQIKVTQIVIAATGHRSLVFTQAKEATCTESGNFAYAYCEDCQKYYAVTEGSTQEDFEITGEAKEDASSFAIAAKGHSYTSLTVAYDAEKMSAAWDASVPCDNGCGTPLALQALPAVPSEGWTLDTENDYIQPTHTKNGSGTYYRSVESGNYTVKISVTNVTIPSDAEHIYAQELTYTAEEYAAAGGQATLTCTYKGCTETITVELPALEGGTEWQETVDAAATCTQAGAKTQTCTVTGSDGETQVQIKVTQIVIAATGHRSLVFTQAKEATCTESGNFAYAYCEDCQKYYAVTEGSTQENFEITGEAKEDASSFAIAAKGHSYGAGSWDAESAKVKFICERCQNVAYAEIASLTLLGDGVEVSLDASDGIGSIEGTVTVTGSYDAVAGTNIAAGTIGIPEGYLAELVWRVSKEERKLYVSLGEVISNGLAVTVHEYVAPVIHLKVDGEEYQNGDSVELCAGTTVHYEATVTVGVLSGASYTVNGGEPTVLPYTIYDLTFEGQAGDVYVITIKASGAQDFVITVTLRDHVYGAWEITQAPTAEETGAAKRVCGTCLKEETLTLPVLDEVNYDYEVTKAASCTQTGTAVYKYKADASIEISVVVPIKAHEYGAGELDAANVQVKFACTGCDDVQTAAITDLTLTAEEGAYASVKDGAVTLYGVTLEGTYEAVSGTPIGAGEIVIPLNSDNLTITAAEGMSGSLTIAFGGVLTVQQPMKVYSVAKEAGATQDHVGYGTWISLQTTSGEFEYRFTFQDIEKGAEDWNSWAIHFVAGNAAESTLRPDDYILNNFGRGDGKISADEAADCTLSGTLPITGDIEFVIARRYADGAYTITVTVTGSTTATVVMKEPVTNGNSMKVEFNGDTCPSFGYSDILYIEKGLAVNSISAEDVTVSGGTALADAMSNVKVSVDYGGAGLNEIVSGSVCEYACEAYDPDADDTYAVTLTYGGKTTTVNVTVDSSHKHNYVDGVCECGTICAHTNVVEGVCAECGAIWTTTSVNQTYQGSEIIAFETWHEFEGVKLTRENSKIVVTGTQLTSAVENYHTVLWEFKEGFTGRLDAYGWPFQGGSSVGAGYSVLEAKIQNGDAVYSYSEGDSFWGYFKELIKDSDFTITFEWKEESAINVTVELIANSGTLSGAAYTCVYSLPITNAGISEFTFHLTAENVNSFTVTDYSMYTWTD